MQFSDTDLDAMLKAHGAVDYQVKLAGDPAGTLFGYFRRSTEFVSPGYSEQLVRHPSITCKTSALAEFDMNHRIEISGVDYKFWREPVPRNSGLSVVGLVRA